MQERPDGAAAAEGKRGEGGKRAGGGKGRAAGADPDRATRGGGREGRQTGPREGGGKGEGAGGRGQGAEANKAPGGGGAARPPATGTTSRTGPRDREGRRRGGARRDLSPLQKVENSETPTFDNPSFLSSKILTDQSKGGEQDKIPQSVEVSEVSIDQSTVVPTFKFVVTMESLEKEAVKNVLVISADGIVYEVISSVPESQKNETQGLMEEGALVLFENSAPAGTTGIVCEGLDPSPEEKDQGSSSQVRFAPAPSPHFAVEPLESCCLR
ncbi:PREDICTED: uncharacterized protein LOC109206838 [Nicotiana attenuata]|uniref:uncharacterized protein LOC109206838 n=1 Tax=Nicotiana attenuata TaxID=49451 RepID=UPI0009057B7B|nr:PREDICTED: uncharacterized protein LOC109206838 [Nicotiana attenuata]